jgi:rhodanese-related sulfurtransferase
VALKMMEKGFTKVYALKGGWREWQNRQFSVEPK